MALIELYLYFRKFTISVISHDDKRFKILIFHNERRHTNFKLKAQSQDY